VSGICVLEDCEELYLVESYRNTWLIRAAFPECVHTVAEFTTHAEAADFLAVVLKRDEVTSASSL